ncbi:MAG TPA: helix-turn-helix domain-containing protein [Phycisphaerae bacterium]|nr:helix-turn-helix domain-containing protein [Phycisphaerae bacterium]
MKNENLVSVYEGAFETWKARMALSRIKAMRFPKSEWPDLMQELAILIIQFEYDPDRDSCAKEETALFAAMNRHLLYLMRGRCRDHQGFEQYLRSLGIREDGSYVGAEPSVETDAAVSMDVAQAIQGLTAFDQSVARELAQGMSRGAIARKFDCDWKTVNKAVRRIRAHFEELGINAEVAR